jgi:hypothetical protein
MTPTDRQDKLLHSKLPIDQDEKILGIYKHHWFIYVSTWVVAFIIVIIVMALAAALTSMGGSDNTFADHRLEVIAVASLFSVVVLMGAAVPAYLRSQEMLVLTEEALLQVLQPSLFASKVDQLNLQRMDDVSVRQDFFGTIFGFGHLTIETPGEQDNYEFLMVPHPQLTARAISAAHENYTAAVQGGRMPSNVGAPMGDMPQISPKQYEEFLAYQRMVAEQQQNAPAQTPQVQPAEPSEDNQSQQPPNQQ